MHLIQKVGITQADLCEMEIKPPYGRIDKYQRLSDYLGIPIHALVTNDCTLVPLSFFDKHPHALYKKAPSRGSQVLSRAGEEEAFAYERERLNKANPSLAKLVLPHFKLGNRPGYDMLSFAEKGEPIYIEVKTSADNSPDFALTNQEYIKANKAIANPDGKLITPNSLTNAFGRFIKENHFKDVRLHDLRHSCASILFASGTDLLTIQEILGHAQLTTTITYTHKISEKKSFALTAMSGQLGNNRDGEMEEDKN